MQIAMSYVDAFLEFSSTFQSAKQTNTSYYELFKSRRDTVKAHGGQTGYYERLYKKHWARLMLNHGVAKETKVEVLIRIEYEN